MTWYSYFIESFLVVIKSYSMLKFAYENYELNKNKILILNTFYQLSP